MKKKFVLPGAAAFAAAALSLCLGGGVAHAQETADLPAAPVQTHSLHAANLNPLSVPQEEGDGEGSSPNVPVGDILHSSLILFTSLAATFSVTLLVPVQVPVPMLLALPQVPLPVLPVLPVLA